MRTKAADTADTREAAFADLFHDVFDDVLRFCARRVPAATAEDIAAEALAIAWRRFDDLPTGLSGQRAWLFTTARNLILHSTRNEARRVTLAIRLQEAATVAVLGADGEATVRVDLARAWSLLSAVHQEALALTAWDGLSSTEAAAVLSISPVAYRLRLTRARTALRAHLRPNRTTSLEAKTQLAARTSPTQEARR